MTRQTLQHSLRKTFWDVRAQYSGFTTFCDAHNEARCTERNAIREPSRTWCWEGFHKCRQTSDKRRLPAHTQITSGLVWSGSGIWLQLELQLQLQNLRVWLQAIRGERLIARVQRCQLGYLLLTNSSWKTNYLCGIL